MGIDAIVNSRCAREYVSQKREREKKCDEINAFK